MKRFLALALALTMGLSLSACVQTERYPEIADLLDAGEYENAMLAIYSLYLQNNPTAPTEDPELEHKYTTLSSAVDSLAHYTENLYDLESFRFVYFNGYEYIQYAGMDAVEWLYETALELGTYKNSAEIASRFTVLENKALDKVYWYADSLGNATQSSRVYYIYGSDGGLVTQSQDHGTVGDHYLYNYGTPEYTYDENGLVSQVRYLSGDTVNCVIDYAYHTDGSLASEHYLDKAGNEYNIRYHYENGRLILAQGVPYTEGSSDTMTVTYHYDASGKLVRKEGINDGWDQESDSQFIKTIRYTYDENGHLSSVRKATEHYIKAYDTDTGRILEQCQDVREWTFSYDAEGRLTQNTYATIGITTPDGTPVNGSYRIYTGETSYGRYYVYSPVSGNT